MMARASLLLALSLALAACGSTTPGARAPVSAGMLPAPSTHRGPAAATGGDGVMGRDAASLIRLFGAPRLDSHEGPAHKLQFSSDRCVLDAYLYAPRNGAEPVVTHIDTRSPDGADVERNACIAALRR